MNVGGAHLLLGFLPVSLFLLALILLDSFKLVRRVDVAKSVAAGVLAALASLAANVALMKAGGVSPETLQRFLGPLVEEIVKAALVVWLIRSARIGFLVDAAIHGFAIGTGFALLENVYYAQVLGNAGIGLWLVRGLGTAMMHGGTTAVFAILGKGLSGRGGAGFALFLPGLAIAVLVHVVFNLFVLPPLVTTGLLAAAMPILLSAVFARSERTTRDWLGVGMDRDVEALEQILSGEVVETPVGHYLSQLRSRFPGTVVADMLCMLRVQLELSLRAKGILMARSAGIELPPDPEVRDNLTELRYLEKSVGPVGMLALKPLMAGKERWEQELLRG
ncbi:MAG: PrsW family glutamic-type intramembrane protease [Candidatus Eisenbacteria bacterium]